MFKKTALVAGIGLALSVTAQADYRWELGGDYTMGQTDSTIKDRNTGARVQQCRLRRRQTLRHLVHGKRRYQQGSSV